MHRGRRSRACKPHWLCAFFPNTRPLQDVLEEMETEYQKFRDQINTAVKAKGVEVRRQKGTPRQRGSAGRLLTWCCVCC